MVIYTSPPDLPEAVIQAPAGDCRGTAQFIAGREAGSRLDPDGPLETRLVTSDSLVEGQHVADMTVDVESSRSTYSGPAPTGYPSVESGPMRAEWHVMSQLALGVDSRYVADVLAEQGYCSLTRRDAW
jgi:hypothetical protein